MTTQRISIHPVDPSCEEVSRLICELIEETSRRYQDLGGKQPSPFSPSDALVPGSILLVARLDDHPVGCGALRPIDIRTAEIKRMYVANSARRLGIGRRILSELERHAVSFNYRTLRLETAHRQPEAIALYQSSGFSEIPPFGPYVGNPISICFEKKLAPRPPG